MQNFRHSPSADPDTLSEASRSNVPSGTLLRPKSIWRELYAALSRRWGYSLVRIVAEDVHNLPRRISAVRKMPHLRYGPELPISPWDHSPLPDCRLNNFVHACNEGIRQLRGEYHWLGRLD